MKRQAEKTIQALETALQMEIEGKEFYHKTGQASHNPLAKKLFLRLAEEEDVHIEKVNEIYEIIKSKAGWPERETTFKHEKSLRSVFREAIEGMDREVKTSSSEIEAIKVAMNMEDRSYSFYRSRDEEAVSSAEKSFYQALTAEEREHYLTLLDSYEYLTDPQSWFTKKEHWSLDGV
jgi:rubrerythrin